MCLPPSLVLTLDLSTLTRSLSSLTGPFSFLSRSITLLPPSSRYLVCGLRIAIEICKDKAQAAYWFVTLKAVIFRCQHPTTFSSLRSCKGVQSCVCSPAGILRKKKNLGLSHLYNNLT
ncbi:hypothetical protein AAZX31_01G140100 [Glycine max]